MNIDQANLLNLKELELDVCCLFREGVPGSRIDELRIQQPYNR